MCAISDVMVCPACEGLAVTRGHMAVCTECWWLSPDVRELPAAETEVAGPVLCAEPDARDYFVRDRPEDDESGASGAADA